MKRAADFILISAFCLAVGSFFLMGLALPDRKFSPNENRYLKLFSPPTVETLVNGEFMEDFKQYSVEQFPFRDVWVASKAHLERLSGKKESNGVYFAKEGYLIEKPGYFGAMAQANIAAISALARSDSRPVVVMAVPTAFEQLKEKLPPYSWRDDEERLLSGLIEAGEDGGFKVIDPRGAMKSLDAPAYYRTDHHWTTDAAFEAYRLVIAGLNQTPLSHDDFDRVTLAEDFYGTTWSKAMLFDTEPDAIFAYTPKEPMTYDVTYDGNKKSDRLIEPSYLEGKDKYGAFLDGMHSVADIRTSNKNGLTLVVFKDSYAHCMVPMLACHYERLVLVDLRYYNLDLKALLEEADPTHILFLYNAGSLLKERGVAKISALIK